MQNAKLALKHYQFLKNLFLQLLIANFALIILQ